MADSVGLRIDVEIRGDVVHVSARIDSWRGVSALNAMVHAAADGLFDKEAVLMPPRPTPRQRAVLEAMSRGETIEFVVTPWASAIYVGNKKIAKSTFQSLMRRHWVRPNPAAWCYVITDSGRRAVAREDGGV